MKTPQLIFSCLILGVSSGLSGCGKDTLGDVASRERDRDRERAATVGRDYEKVKGLYEGEANQSDILLDLDTTRVSKEGSIVAQPVLVGNLVFSPRILIGTSKERLKITLPFSDGIYDASSQDISFTLEKDTKPSAVRCKTSPDLSQFDCRWFARLSSLDFSVLRTQGSRASLKTARTESYGGVYAGEMGGRFHVELLFRSARTTGTSTLPNLALVGSFRLRKIGDVQPAASTPGSDVAPDVINAVHNQIYTFTDGTFDPASHSIVMTIDFEGPKITVNCEIESAQKLNCEWLSRNPFTFSLTKKPE